jgi:hypothetical protein
MSETRPLRKGEFIQNPGGGKSTERTIGVDDPRLNKGKPTLIPTLFMVDGILKAFSSISKTGEITVSQEQVRGARDAAVSSGLVYPSFPSHDGPGGSTEFAKERSRTGGIANGPLGRKPKNNIGEILGE